MKHAGKIVLFFILSFTLPLLVISQDYPYNIDYYNFINYKADKFIYKGNSEEQYERLFKQFNSLFTKGQGQISIYHFGDSHIQADFFPGQMRKRIQTFNKDGISSRGLIFPFSIAKTNSPPDYQISYSGIWDRCKNTSRDAAYSMGITGMNVYSFDMSSAIRVKFNYRDYPAYQFNKVRIYHNCRDVYAEFSIQNYSGRLETEYNLTYGYTDIYFDSYQSELNLTISRKDSSNIPFILYGISFEIDEPGIIYSSVGVNGAETSSFLRCSLFEEQLKAMSPDWVIISLGTNDAYPKGFSSAIFERNYDSLLKKIRVVLPESCILLTTPGDSYRNRKILNQNNEQARLIILKLAEKYNASVWDFYTVMGGLNSINKWHSKGLTNEDKLHLSKNGYIFQGNLMFNAFLKAYDNYIEQNN